MRAGKTEGCTDSEIGERPLYANHILRAPFAFFLGRAFKLEKLASGADSKIGKQPLYANQYLRTPFAFFLGRAFKLAPILRAALQIINIYACRLFLLGWLLLWCIWGQNIAFLRDGCPFAGSRFTLRRSLFPAVFGLCVCQCVRRRIGNVLCPYLAMPFLLRMCRSRAITM
jgi:hypothetical protein